jgi:hypothetical protein
MRALVFALAAMLAVVAPGMAAAETGGHIKITIAGIDIDESFYDDYCEGECGFDIDSDGVFALSGAVVTDVNDLWRIQFDGASADANANYSYDYSEYNYEYSRAFSLVQVHATRTVGMFDVGGFVGLFNNEGTSYYVYGVEGAANFSRGEVTLSVAGATSPNTDDDYYFGDDIVTVAASGTFALTESVYIGATVSNTDFGNSNYYSYYFGGDRDVTAYGVSVAYDIPSTDFTVAAGYRTADSDTGDTDFFGVSLAWTFGEGSRGRVMPGAEALIPDAIAATDGFFIS